MLQSDQRIRPRAHNSGRHGGGSRQRRGASQVTKLQSAITSELAAVINGLVSLQAYIKYADHNITRFVIMSLNTPHI